MSNLPPRITPPPLPVFTPQPPSAKPNRPSGPDMSVGLKIVLMGLLCCVLMIGALAIWLMAYDRNTTSADVSQDIVGQWGEKTYIDGPFLAIEPDTDSLRPAGIVPVALNVNANVETMSLHRGIYEAEVFSAAISMKGHFRSSDFKRFESDSITVKIDIDPHNVTETSPLKIGDTTYAWSRSDSSLHACIPIADLDKIEDVPFSTSIKARGSGGFFIMPSADTNTITIIGNATNPSFSREQLPVSRKVGKDGFSARWEIRHTVGGYNVCEYVGADFLLGVDRYQKVCRAIKYAFIIIILTFFSVFFTETTMHRPIPMFNYFLIGVALILFYSLLLGLSEHMSFGASYLIAAVMTITLITCYMWKMLGSKAVGLAICGVLSIMYGFCYVMLCISTYALLFGSLLLFVALAATMYGSLKIQYR